ncbi:MAG: hypothetical protein ACRDU9_04220 [Acidimicrobiia bacterium]
MTLLVGTTAGLFQVDGSSEQLIGDTRIMHISRDAAGWWVVDSDGRITHDGAEAAVIATGSALCVQPSPDTIWIGADRARLFALESGELVEDEFFTEAPGRDQWFTPWGDPAAVRSMTLDADHTLYINVHVGGVLRYDNTGLVPTLDISADVHQLASHPTAPGAIFAACARGLAATHNGHDFDIRSDGLHAPYCRAVAVMDDSVLISASTGPRTSQGRLYKSPLWEGEFTPLTRGLPEWFDGNVDTHCVVAQGSVAHVGHNDTVWRSEDAGETWSVLTAELPRITCLA